ncbi:23S rRNA (uracil(1939)-C(5))-methyltransferase RlmD [Desulforhabdus amnigena]|jgi:23S rRNA (uracil1939-C5)-methyltransferase|uniref:RNA methyltransferase n=1 Tax=Desulforhabdus amnigena TaxID=40218 RepID=A0A9W6D1W8_9BACT|nr:23S rRNA (uracil(1939)-C(5))-methyltransferase RlmD [Desulforhabdus amnigena]NLJ29380.1 23S rRNA (uracil(1939)-C(5))-methyltransferase RlmD [Deltaproteobacteria bacterium]GLI34350.1 putative RNA methyltransferase [Desulforhabdus amnigena]
MDLIRKGAEIELVVEKLAFGGKAVARVDGFVIFLEHALPGQRVLARVNRKKRQYAEAQVLGILSQSSDYVEPFCPHFGVCGGCRWQDLSYAEQLRWKRVHVLESIEHLAGVEEAVVEPTTPSPEQRHYRNKMEFTFSDRRWLSPQEIALKEVEYSKSFALGLHVRGFFDKVFNVENCFLQSHLASAILKETREWCRKSGLPAYSVKDHQGFWRFLVIRETKRTDQLLVHLLTTPQEENEKIVDALAAYLLDRFPAITTFVHSVTQKKAQVAFGDSSRVVSGPGFIEEEIGSLRFRISAHSFFQTNPSAAEKLYEAVARLGDFKGHETVWDLYCGTGSIALFIASRVGRVVGFEVVEDAIRDAYMNCELNGIDNCSFLSGDLKDVIKEAQQSVQEGGLPDVVITDPPRAGMHPNVVKALLELAPKRIITVSCNPSTLARDLTYFLDRYEIQKIQPFDLFPHTPHIECVVRLERKF